MLTWLSKHMLTLCLIKYLHLRRYEVELLNPDFCILPLHTRLDVYKCSIHKTLTSSLCIWLNLQFRSTRFIQSALNYGLKPIYLYA
jgi:hypothetical protein